MGYLEKKAEKAEHNWNWINPNRDTAYRFAEKHCLFSKAEKLINSKVVTHSYVNKLGKEMKSYTYPDNIDELMADFNQKNKIRIQASENCIIFTLMFGDDQKKSNLSFPLDYEIEPIEFGKTLIRVFANCKNKIGYSIKDYKAESSNYEASYLPYKD